MEKIKKFNLQEFSQFTQKQFNKKLIVGSWLVWYDNNFYAEWIFHDSGRFEQLLQNTQQNIGNWIYLPDLQIINISFWEKDIESLNFYFYHSSKKDTVVLLIYQDSYATKLYLVKKELFSTHYQQKAALYTLDIFTDNYNEATTIQNQIETTIINKEIGKGCAAFGLYILLSLALGYGALLAWFILFIIYASYGEKPVKEKLLNARHSNKFNLTKGFNLPDISDQLTRYNNTKFLYGLVGFILTIFIGYVAFTFLFVYFFYESPF